MHLTSTLIYRGVLRCEAEHLASAQRIETDAPKDNEGLGQAFSPTDLVATALGACALTILGILARREAWILEGTEVRVLKRMSTSGSRRIVGIELDFHFPQGEYESKKRLSLERAAKTCPVALSLHPDLEQIYRFHYPNNVDE